MRRLWLGLLFPVSHIQMAAAAAPSKIYGVNLGSWLVLEPWMLPQEWMDMGGEICDQCSKCIMSEFAFVKAHPDWCNQKFAQHWATWFTQTHVQQLKDLGINTVRIPLGYWIVEDLVDRSTEFYPRGGLVYLVQGLKWLSEAGIQVILVNHAAPGVQSANQMFTGHCTADVEFYTPRNYGRALTWTAVMTGLSHTHPNFASVFSIQAVNEPIMDSSKTPDYVQSNFVQTIRAMETLLGVSHPAALAEKHAGLLAPLQTLTGMPLFSAHTNQTGPLSSILGEIERAVSPATSEAVANALPILMRIEKQLGMSDMVIIGQGSGSPLTTSFMDVNWQRNNPSNPADAADGQQIYDNHLYYNFGGVADANPDAYLASVCNLMRVQQDAALGNSPLVFGEWALSTNFDATDAFLRDWADAQKLIYSSSGGWIFWNFRIENSALAKNADRQWSYLEGVRRGYLTQDPSQYSNPGICDRYRKEL